MKKPLPRLLCAVLIAGAPHPGITEYRLPDLGNPERRVFDHHTERLAGYSFMRQIRAHKEIVEDPILNQYLHDLGVQIVNVADHPERTFRFFWVNDNSINAFAGPDGRIGINFGLLFVAHSEEELISVIAHEIAHVTQNHVARAIEKNQDQQSPAMLAGLAAVLAGVYSGNPRVTGAGIYASVAKQYEVVLANSRQFENEADSIAQTYLAKAQYNNLAMPLFFQRLQENSADGDVPQLLRTHPLTADRLENALNRAQNHSQPPPKESLTFRLVQARARYLSRGVDENILQGEAMEYYRALKWLEEGSRGRILSWLEGEPRHLFYRFMRISATSDTRKQQTYLSRLREEVPYHLMTQTLALELNPHQEETLDYLSTALHYSAQPFYTQHLIGDYYARNGQRDRYLYHEALSLFEGGYLRNSLSLLEEAYKLSDDSSFRYKVANTVAHMKNFLN